MKGKTAGIIAAVLISAAIAAGGYMALKDAPPEPSVMLYFGLDVRLGLKEDARLYEPFLAYLRKKTGYNFKLRFAGGHEETWESLGRGACHFAAVGAVSYLKANEAYGAKILARGLNKENKAVYQAIIFTRPDSDIRSIEDIKGRSFAFSSRDSTQGHLIPRKMLQEAGIELNTLKIYEYCGSHKDAVDAVISGRLDAGGAQDTLVRAMETEGKIRIVKASGFYPSSGIAANKDVDQKIVDM